MECCHVSVSPWALICLALDVIDHVRRQVRSQYLCHHPFTICQRNCREPIENANLVNVRGRLGECVRTPAPSCQSLTRRQPMSHAAPRRRRTTDRADQPHQPEFSHFACRSTRSTPHHTHLQHAHAVRPSRGDESTTMARQPYQPPCPKTPAQHLAT